MKAGPRFCKCLDRLPWFFFGFLGVFFSERFEAAGRDRRAKQGVGGVGDGARSAARAA
jgi:hypothetical protein